MAADGADDGDSDAGHNDGGHGIGAMDAQERRSGRLGSHRWIAIANLYDVDVTEMYEQIVLSLIIGNGDAHLKNFAIIYKDINGPFRLSPLYDVVCTKPYGDDSTALSINKSRNYPSRIYLEKMGDQFGVREPKNIIDRIADSVDTICAEHSELMSESGAQDIKTSIISNRDQVLAKARVRA